MLVEVAGDLEVLVSYLINWSLVYGEWLTAGRL
jgi:hypothetical protein